MSSSKEAEVNLTTELAGFILPNPVIIPSGIADLASQRELATDSPNHFLPGGVTTKTIRFRPVAGNPTPRACELPGGMLNAIGLAGVGIEAFLNDQLAGWLDLGRLLIINISGESIEEYVELTRRLTRRLAEYDAQVILELNASCPNVKAGMAFGVDPQLAFDLVRAVKAETSLPVFFKATPNVTDIVSIAQAVEEAGADGISAINTVLAMALDRETLKPALGSPTGMGGLSGKALKPIGLRCVYQICQAVKIPVIGIGGITTAQDTIEYIAVGATAVGVGTANFTDHLVMAEIIEGLTEILKQRGLSSLAELRGIALKKGGRGDEN